MVDGNVKSKHDSVFTALFSFGFGNPPNWLYTFCSIRRAIHILNFGQSLRLFWGLISIYMKGGWIWILILGLKWLTWREAPHIIFTVVQSVPLVNSMQPKNCCLVCVTCFMASFVDFEHVLCQTFWHETHTVPAFVAYAWQIYSYQNTEHQPESHSEYIHIHVYL